MSAIYKRDESKIFSRINVLRENMLDAVPSLSSERAVLATEFYKNNEGMPPKLLRAHLLEYLLAKKEVLIRIQSLSQETLQEVFEQLKYFSQRAMLRGLKMTLTTSQLVSLIHLSWSLKYVKRF